MLPLFKLDGRIICGCDKTAKKNIFAQWRQTIAVFQLLNTYTRSSGSEEACLV